MITQTETNRQKLAEDLWRREGGYVISGLVHTLAMGTGDVSRGELYDLCEEAMELSAPTQDWEEAATQEGIAIREADDGTWQYSTKDDRETWNDLDADDESEAWQRACEAESIDAYEREIYEHWIVSDWLGRKLQERGERVGELDNLTVWGRATTGQSIALDHVMQEIAVSLQSREG